MIKKNHTIPKSIDLTKAKIIPNSDLNRFIQQKVYVIPEKCIGCGQCAEVCPFGIFKKEEKKYFAAEPKRCIECSACKKNCPTNAIIMEEVEGCGCLWDVRERQTKTKKCC
mgnify:CR=1 FL=1